MRLIIFTLLVIVGTNAVPKYEFIRLEAVDLGLKPRRPIPANPVKVFIERQNSIQRQDKQEDEDPELQKIQELVDSVCTTLTDMQIIALIYDPEAGSRLENILQGQIGKAAAILREYKDNSRRRVKRQAGGDALNAVGQALVDTKDLAKGDVGKMSKKGQCDMDKRYKKGLAKCKADACKNAAGFLAGAEAAECG